MSNNVNFFVEPHALANMNGSEPILVALSGGADSSCLLHLLSAYSKKAGCKLYAAHVNHNIRTQSYSNEAYRDEQFCRDLCKDLGVEIFLQSIDVPSLARESGQSLETAAREARYAFFAEVMQKNGIRILATAHNADDNLETLIFNLCRGCSVEGLCGIPRQRPFPEVDGAVIVRPIIDATKSEILDMCAANNIPYVTDSTNFETDCTRNRIRHNVIPELVSLFDTPQRAAMRLSHNAADASAFIREHADSFIRAYGEILPRDALCNAHPAVAGRVLSILFKTRFGCSLESTHIDAIINIARLGREGASVSLPCASRATVKRGNIVFETDSRAHNFDNEQYDVALHEGINALEPSPFAIVISKDESSPAAQLETQYTLYATACIYSEQQELKARNRREGDVILDGGIHKKIKKLMCDKKVDLYDRASLPLVCFGSDVIYVPLCAIADNAKKDKNKPKIQIYIYKKINGDTKP
ncbi:MAG: tRNA lysidine(34) synthetase TilS [Ruminococcaceae bacterium]|nr:tRNA lysidine(34) synthetase TilS [Oscillospiraceae bacterium]